MDGRGSKSKGRKAYTNGQIEIRLYPGDEIPEGFYPGRNPKTLKKISEINSQKYYCNNGIKNIVLNIGDPIPEGFKKGTLPFSQSHKDNIRKGKSTEKAQEKYIKTCIDRYGTMEKFWEHRNGKIKDTMYERYDGKYYSATDEYIKRIRKTKLERYGIENYNNTEKSNMTKRKNHTFNTSKIEEDFYLYLISVFGKNNVCRNYRDEKRYPFNCDFYIPSEDLFIELNAHWTHGGKPYDPNDEECQEQLLRWQSSSKEYNKNAINTWTVRDVNKFKIAKLNNLNYLTIYSNSIQECIDKLYQFGLKNSRNKYGIGEDGEPYNKTISFDEDE